MARYSTNSSCHLYQQAWTLFSFVLCSFKQESNPYINYVRLVYRHDLEVNGGKGLIVDPRTKYVYQRP